jgi:hypothetical protein
MDWCSLSARIQCGVLVAFALDPIAFSGAVLAHRQGVSARGC